MALVHHLGQCRYFSKQPSICAVGTPLPPPRLPFFVGRYLSLPPFVNVKRSSWRSALRRASFVFPLDYLASFCPSPWRHFKIRHTYKKSPNRNKNRCTGSAGLGGASFPFLPLLERNKLRISRGNLVFVLENPVLRQTHTEAKKGILPAKKGLLRVSVIMQ